MSFVDETSVWNSMFGFPMILVLSVSRKVLISITVWLPFAAMFKVKIVGFANSTQDCAALNVQPLKQIQCVISVNLFVIKILWNYICP